ncbi:nuclear transport factor 2 family protein [Candidatus Gracilibacteria bacterium]|nr:nuclear transport factor 2 family protein [Candidatus Gracilibacteria bacterium]
MNVHDQHLAIRAVVEDYVYGWYENKPTRTRRCLHPQLAKRLVKDDATIEELDAATLIAYVQGREGVPPSTTQQQAIEILGVYGNIASVRAEMTDWVDFLHLGCFNGEWKIVNAIWSLKAQQETIGAATKRTRAGGAGARPSAPNAQCAAIRPHLCRLRSSRRF